MRELAKYETDDGLVTITDVDVKRVLCDNPNVTESEMKLFVELCKAQKLNPFTREAHLVKYGQNPATFIVGKDVFTKRAQRNPRFKGFEAGLSLSTKDGRMIRREGSMTLPGEKIFGGWCRVHVDGYEVPMFDEVSFDEYAVRKRDGSLNSTWRGKPGTMIRKVAIVHALREAFPDDLAGLYDSSEMQVEEPPQGPAEASVEAVEAAPDEQVEHLEEYEGYVEYEEEF